MEQIMEALLTTTQPSTAIALDPLVIRLGPLKSHFTDDEFFELCVLNRDLRIEMTKEGEMGRDPQAATKEVCADLPRLCRGTALRNRQALFGSGEDGRVH